MLAAPRVGLLADGVEGDGRLRVEARLDLRGAFANQQELRPGVSRGGRRNSIGGRAAAAGTTGLNLRALCLKQSYLSQSQ